MTYESWVQSQASLIHADGCTMVSEWHHGCCLEHDLACFHGKDPRSAYVAFKADPSVSCWSRAKTMSRRQADYAFLHCNECASKTPLGSARSLLRFLGVRLGAIIGIGVRQPTSSLTK